STQSLGSRGLWNVIICNIVMATFMSTYGHQGSVIGILLISWWRPDLFIVSLDDLPAVYNELPYYAALCLCVTGLFPSIMPHRFATDIAQGMVVTCILAYLVKKYIQTA